jgi:Membrane-bound serine protease (ClpP class)
MRYLVFIITILLSLSSFAQQSKFYVIEITEEISASSVRRLSKGLKESIDMDSDWVIIHMNTYGGAVDAADSMRSAILYHPIPIAVFINNQAASAGALISIACDSIYMRKGASIGAATVVNQSGEPMPDKYQAFMRSMMRATAEVTGRDPKIAEAMVGIDGKVLSYTLEEAMENGYCEGEASSIDDVAKIISAGEDYFVNRQELTTLDKIILFMLSPFIQGILLMLIVGGIYFEFQSPGLGLPSIVAITAAVLYFSPLYLEGIAEYWEILLFIVGVILLLVEVLVLPGFGVAGILGTISIIVGLSFGMIDNNFFYYNGEINFGLLLRPFAVMTLASFLGLSLSIYLAGKFMHHEALPMVSLATQLKDSDGFVGVESNYGSLVGREALVQTAMRPSGKIEIDGKWYEATMEIGIASKGDRVVVTRFEGGRLYCENLPR